MKAWILKVHRWLALIFALPLAVVIITGLILSFEPMAIANAVKPGSITPERFLAMLDRHDPRGQANGLAAAPYNGTVTLRMSPSVTIDLATGEAATTSNWLSNLFRSSRGLHERLIWDLGWLVEVSTIVMLLLTALGIVMGLPRISNSLAGWHKAAGWFLLPLIILSPLSGLGILYGITLASPQPAVAAAKPPAKLRDTVTTIAKSHDLSALISLRRRGKRMIARVMENGELRNYSVTNAGTVAMSRNWPRLIHEGNWMGNLSALINIITSLALVILLTTGLVAWTGRSLRRAANRRKRSEAAISIH